MPRLRVQTYTQSVLDVWISDTRILDQCFGKLWWVTTMAAEGEQPLGCGTTRILSGEHGSIRFQYKFSFPTLVISGRCTTIFDLRTWSSLLVEPDYASTNQCLLQLPYNNYFEMTLDSGLTKTPKLCRCIAIVNYYVPTAHFNGYVSATELQSRSYYAFVDDDDDRTYNCLMRDEEAMFQWNTLIR
jgi:hypothetical protein